MDTAARRFADSLSAKQSDRPTGAFYSTVLAVTPGGASDGNALITVDWRGGSYLAAGYDAAYTPAVGHRIKCVVIADQIHIDGRVIGQP